MFEQMALNTKMLYYNIVNNKYILININVVVPDVVPIRQYFVLQEKSRDE